MTHRVFLHPGPPKTGTTYLQSLLYANRDSFLAQGLTITGDQGAHYRAANELVRRKSLRMKEMPEGAWAHVRDEVLSAPGDVVMSCERYSLLGLEHIRRVVEDLGDREVHVVLTLRDVPSTLPARWQEGIKNGGSVSWASFLERVATDTAQLRKVTRAMPTLNAWAKVLPAERIHIVTVPPSSAPRTLLLERFCEVVGADASKLETLEASRANPSIDLVSTELIRRLNANKRTKLSGYAQHFEIKMFLAGKLAKQNRGKPQLTPEAFAAGRAESEALIRRIEEGGFHVVGDLADLTSSKAPASTGAGVEVDPEQVIDAAVVAISALARRSAGRARQLNQLENQRRRWTPRRVAGAVRRRLRRR